MNLRDLEYLVALDEHRHFGRAALACDASQSTLSTQVKKLEQELGIDLVERDRRRVLLTTAGLEVAARAKLILGQIHDIRGIAARGRDPERGTLTLGAFPTIAPYLLPHVVPHLHARYPHLRLRLIEDKSDELITGMRSGRIDAAILALPIHDPTFTVEPLFREDFVLATSRGSDLAADDGPVRGSVLEAQMLMLLDDGHCLRDQALDVCRTTGALEDPGFRATSLETLRQMVASGGGTTLLPRLAVAPPVATPDTVVLRELEPTPSRDIGLVWRMTSSFSPLLPQVARTLRQVPPGLVAPLGPVDIVVTDPVSVQMDPNADHARSRHDDLPATTAPRHS